MTDTPQSAGFTEKQVAFLKKVHEVLACRFPRCRDCADDGPICPSSGLPCDLEAAFKPICAALTAAAQVGEVLDQTDTLKAELAENKQARMANGERWIAAVRCVEKAEDELAEARRVIEFYANRDNWTFHIIVDDGQRAREWIDRNKE